MKTFTSDDCNKTDKRGLWIKNFFQSKDNYLYRIIKDRALVLMVLPGTAFFILFYYLPMYGIIIAFKDFDMTSSFFGGDWVGLKHFKDFINNYYFFRLMKNTFLLSFNTLVFSFPMPIILALMLNEVKNKSFKKLTQSATYFPHFVSTVVIVGIMVQLGNYDGVLNDLLSYLGIGRQTFFTDPGWFRPLYISSEIWQKAGYESILYLAALATIPTEQYESATIDGAKRLQQIFYITIPGLVNTIVIILIIRLGQVLRLGFEKVYLMYNPAVYEVADVIPTYVYRRGIQGLDFSYSTAVEFFNSVISLILVIIANYISRKVANESLW